MAQAVRRQRIEPPSPRHGVGMGAPVAAAASPSGRSRPSHGTSNSSGCSGTSVGLHIDHLPDDITSLIISFTSFDCRPGHNTSSSSSSSSSSRPNTSSKGLLLPDASLLMVNSRWRHMVRHAPISLTVTLAPRCDTSLALRLMDMFGWMRGIVHVRFKGNHCRYTCPVIVVEHRGRFLFCGLFVCLCT
jgi:hypothetical protein